MEGSEHYAEAERILAGMSGNLLTLEARIMEAQVHATLAVAAGLLASAAEQEDAANPPA